MANINNRSMNGIQKMSMASQLYGISKNEKSLFWIRDRENGTKSVYSVQHGTKFVLIVKTSITFQDSAKTNNGQSSLAMCKNKTNRIVVKPENPNKLKDKLYSN